MESTNENQENKCLYNCYDALISNPPFFTLRMWLQK